MVMGLFAASCSDDDYSISSTPLLTDDSVVTGSADVTATSATMHGTVSGLESQSASAYTAGFYYGASEDALTERVLGNSGAEFSATVSGQPNDVIYYQAFVTLQGKVTYKGKVSSTLLTNAKAITGDVANITANGATIDGKLSEFPADAESGIVISSVEGDENVRAGVRVAGTTAAEFSVDAKGMLPNTTYYYAAYLDLGAGVVFGETKSFTTADKTFDANTELVDLGLSTKWAKCNLGAADETELGGLFGFGDLKGFNTSYKLEDYASTNVYKSAQDIAYNATGGACTIPTISEYEELFRCCKVEWTEVDGVSGYEFTGPNGNSIFLPAAGSRIQGDITGVGQSGRYLSGSINVSDPQFALSYYFDATTNARSATPVYQALSVRPVSLAKNVPFNKSFFTTKWYLDNGQDGKQHVFEGPFTQYGATDNWNTITNNYPNIEQSIHWEMGTGNGWIGYTYGKDYGYMEFAEDGTFKVHRIAEDGTMTDETGRWTLDETNKTVTVDIDVIYGNTWLPTKKGTLKILTLTEDGMQIALDAGDGTYAYALNYYSEAKRAADEEIQVSLLCVDANWGGTWGEVVDRLSPAALEGSHTLTYHGSCNGAMVFTLDFIETFKRYPNAYVRIDAMRCDGQAIKFDAGKFFYGYIEKDNDGIPHNYRVELFNIWGKGANNEKVLSSPFSNATNVGSDPAFSFANTLEIGYTVFTDAHPEGVYTPKLAPINASWGGPWDFTNGNTIEVVYENCQYKLKDNSKVVIDYTAPSDVDYSGGCIMTFVQTDNLFKYFPGTQAVLNEFYLDGVATTDWKANASKIVNTSADGNGIHHRLELFNCYGETKDNCAFGQRDGDVMHSLGFNSSMKLDITYKSLYAVPQW